MIQQLRQYVLLLLKVAISQKYGFKRGDRVLLIFEHKTNLEDMLHELHTQLLFSHMKNLFLFKHYDDVMKPELMGFWVSGGREVETIT